MLPVRWILNLRYRFSRFLLKAIVAGPGVLHGLSCRGVSSAVWEEKLLGDMVTET